MADDEYVEGDSNSEAADAPGAIPADAERAEHVGDVIDSVSVHDAPVQKIGAHRNAARTAASKKAFAEAILEHKAKTAAAKPENEYDPEAAPEPAAVEAKSDPVTAAPAAPVAAPPAPSLDPEVRKLKEQLAAERLAVEKERAELEKRKAEPVETPPDALSLEDYIDSPHRAYRNWLEAMRGEKFATDDEFKGEVKDFITAMSTDVLGVPLPENVKAQFDAAQARKIVKTHRTIQERKAAAAAAKAEKERAAATEKAEAERVEREWSQAATVLSQQFAPQQNAEGKHETSAAAKAYPWLAAEEEPGRIVVDVIRAAFSKDGTQLSWQEASKQANDYLADQASRYYAKRKALLQPAPAAAPAPVAAKPKPAAPAPTPAPPPKPVGRARNGWDRDAHMEKTKAAFRNLGKTE